MFDSEVKRFEEATAPSVAANFPRSPSQHAGGQTERPKSAEMEVGSRV